MKASLSQQQVRMAMTVAIAVHIPYYLVPEHHNILEVASQVTKKKKRVEMNSFPSIHHTLFYTKNTPHQKYLSTLYVHCFYYKWYIKCFQLKPTCMYRETICAGVHRIQIQIHQKLIICPGG